MQLKQLEVFLQVSRQRSFSRAAGSLGYSQSAVRWRSLVERTTSLVPSSTSRAAPWAMTEVWVS